MRFDFKWRIFIDKQKPKPFPIKLLFFNFFTVYHRFLSNFTGKRKVRKVLILAFSEWGSWKANPIKKDKIFEIIYRELYVGHVIIIKAYICTFALDYYTPLYSPCPSPMSEFGHVWGIMRSPKKSRRYKRAISFYWII